MTNKVKRYLELGKLCTFTLVRDNYEAYEKVCAELKSLKPQMCLKELKSLERHISCREFHEGILPLIKQIDNKQED